MGNGLADYILRFFVCRELPSGPGRSDGRGVGVRMIGHVLGIVAIAYAGLALVMHLFQPSLI